jgi:hypothetical protein
VFDDFLLSVGRVGGGILELFCPTWKNGYRKDCCAVGRRWGFQLRRSSINFAPSLLEFVISCLIGVAMSLGNLKFIAEANWYPSTQSSFTGVPNTEHILKIISTSLAPGNNGRRVYNSAMIQPMANISIGEL